MTTTETTPAKREQKPRDVDYTLEIVDDLPDSDLVRRSPLEDQLDKIKATPEAHGKWVRIGSYANGSASSAAANVLRQRHGDKARVEGWEVRSKRINDGSEGEPRTGLFVKYDPKQIVEGARAEFDASEKARKAKLAAKGKDEQATGKDEQATGQPTEAASGQTPREAAGGAGQSSGTAEASAKNAPKGK